MRSVPPRRGVHGLVPVVLLLVSCSGANSVDRASEANRDERAGSLAMAESLAVIYRRAIAAPARNPFLNRARAESIAVQLRQSGGLRTDVEGRYLLAQEQVLAGQSRDAIALLEQLANELGVSVHTVTAQSKPLLDLLAIANLRLGEQENCLDGTAANACILPLDGSARHRKPEGARKAIALYSALTRVFPNDLGSRWLLNMSWMALGGYPDSVTRDARVPGLSPTVAAQRAFPRFPNIAGRLGVQENGLSGGLAVNDFDGDGTLDLFLTSWGLRDPIQLLIGDGRGGYDDRSTMSDLTGITGGLNVSHADVDNDGRTDLFIMRGAWLADAATQPNSLLRNLGDGRFADVTIRAGLYRPGPTPTAAWSDFNRDGWVDLFVGHESLRDEGGPSFPSELWVNNRDGTFTEVSARVGLNVDHFVKGAAWGDVNNDGLPDLYVSNLRGPNQLFINRGGRSIERWRFEECAETAGVQRPFSSFSTWFFDYNQDGWEDLLVLSYDIGRGQALHDAVASEYVQRAGRPSRPGDSLAVPVESSRLFRNNRDGSFTDVTRTVGLADHVIFAMGSAFGDLDNDGWLDFYVGTGNPDLRSIIPNRMYRNVGGAHFEEVTLPGGFGHIQKGHAATFADLDRDGDQDIYMVMGGAYEGDVYQNVLFENPGWPGRSWLTLDLEGTTSNRSAIGARVMLRTTDASGQARTLYRTVGAGSSFGSGTLQLHMGLDRAVRIDTLRIIWPDSSRTTSTYTALTVNGSYRIVQGRSPVVLARPPLRFPTLPPAAHVMNGSRR